jgi:hypothetical protein
MPLILECFTADPLYGLTRNLTLIRWSKVSALLHPPMISIDYESAR